MNQIVKPLLLWYQKNKRILPWRIDQKPYHIWISEIMLQQTRIEAVKEYYNRFMREVPNIELLATIEEDKLLKLWQGLGYYNRARNLKKTAQIICNEYNGEFPNTYDEIIKLPGIGEYTAGAIGSICFSLPVVAIDGNVLRVMMRLLNCSNNIDDKKTKELVKQILLSIVPQNSGDFNEGLMELGETICLPNTLPKCEECPISKYCLAYRNNTMNELPVRNQKKEKKIEYYTVFLIICDSYIAIEKRKEIGLLHNLWQFPNVEGKLTMKNVKEIFPQAKIKKSIHYQHIFTHKVWNNKVFIINCNEKDIKYTWATVEELLTKFAIPTAFMPVLEQYQKRI